MTTLYRSVLIESAEQAEALPIGTLAKRPQHYSIEKVDECPDEWTDTCNAELRTSSDVVGWSALVPIEAEEEYSAENSYGGRDLTSSLAYAQLDAELHGTTAQTRLVTPWTPTEEA